MQVMRRWRGTVSGEVLARETNVSLRTIRRDIATLQGMGAHIDGEAGVGYILRPGFLLPPMSFTADEIQALVAGAQWVGGQPDRSLALAAQNALAKIGGVIPAEMRPVLEDDTFYVGSEEAMSDLDLGEVRRAIRHQRKMHIIYTDQSGATGGRTIWPIMIGFVDSQRLISAWCELRQDFRVFCADRIRHADFLDEHYPGNRRRLAKEWRSDYCPRGVVDRAAE
jgi:predicted DNA-binding transcriptional regulator YafY